MYQMTAECWLLNSLNHVSDEIFYVGPNLFWASKNSRDICDVKSQ